MWFGSPGGPGVEVSRFRFRYVEIAGVLRVWFRVSEVGQLTVKYVTRLYDYYGSRACVLDFGLVSGVSWNCPD